MRGNVQVVALLVVRHNTDVNMVTILNGLFLMSFEINFFFIQFLNWQF